MDQRGGEVKEDLICLCKSVMGSEVRVERSDEDNYQIKFVHVLKSLNFNQSSSCVLSR